MFKPSFPSERIHLVGVKWVINTVRRFNFRGHKKRPPKMMVASQIQLEEKEVKLQFSS